MIVLEIALTHEQDGSVSALVLSQIGGHGLHKGFTSAEEALRAIAALVGVREIVVDPPPQEIT